MNRRALLGIAILLAITGASLVIFGAVFTAIGSDYVGTYSEYPIWSPPRLPTDSSVSANYTLNFVGIGLLAAALAVPLLSRSSRQK